MANDRLYLRCAHCGEKITLLKYWPSDPGSYCPNPLRLAEFAERHLECAPAVQNFCMTLGEDRCFTVETEGTAVALDQEAKT